ncbi:uncharacterized protein K452DRAFT_325077 [Aplosporella prunicola CBS 121167]|uniref:DASH complex subunit DAM1 n=1 Tax=Aplosporella prunicola CBS 121167 TaxID=1176127 RepID=A0A6A6BNQ7_9PEZI|nr:uncharacterized protein K452DRAFT_325077 [Aplosporella prunicola CBS 121167]KAF2144477.1 hypothetical protein K452DRAFT_325077 [Aplosporella prunicola CBS 121167]
MASTTPTPHSRSASRGRAPSRPTTPLRASSRSSLRTSVQHGHGSPSHHRHSGHGQHSNSSTPLEALEPQFAEFSDSMADLEANLMHLQLMHESLARFSESFAAFLYGLNMNAFCVDFPEAPVPESFRRQRVRDADAAANNLAAGGGGGLMGGLLPARSRDHDDAEATFLTTDTSFVENPPSSKQASKFRSPAAPAAPSTRGSTRGGRGRGRGSGRGSGLPRGSGIARGVGRGTGRGGAR